MIKAKLDHIGLNVADLEKSIVFYQELFGFSVIAKWDKPKQAFISTDDCVLGLIEMPTYDFQTYTMAHLAFSCAAADFSDIVSKIKNSGLEIVSDRKEQRGGETILFRDPSGNILEVCYPAISEWQALLKQEPAL